MNREQEHLLTRPFLMLGSRKLKIDYMLAVRRHPMWLLESKRPSAAVDGEVGAAIGGVIGSLLGRSLPLREPSSAVDATASRTLPP